MSEMDKREQAFERKFALDEELKFRVTARAIKALAQWAAGHMGLMGADADSYVLQTLEAEIKPPRHGGLISKIEDDFRSRNVAIFRAAIAHELESLLEKSRKDVMEG